MKIKTTKPLSIRLEDTNDLVSFKCGEVADVDTTLGNELVSCGLATLYKDVTPEGTKTITANGSYDVSIYESATVNVGTVTVTYDTNGGTGSISAQTVIAGNAINLDDGSGITAPTGLKFVGWATTADATTPNATSPYTADTDVTLYAVYADDEETYTITYDANGGTGAIAPVAVIAGQSSSLSDGTGLTAPTGKEFAGWATTADAETADVTSPYTPEADITLYAVYADDEETYTITYDANEGTGSIEPASVVAGESVNLSDGTGLTAPTGKEFAGWATTADAETADVTSPYTPAASITLYAVWENE